MVLALVWRQVHIRIDRMATRCGPRIFCVEEDCAAWIFHMIGARLCGKKENHFGNDLIDRTVGIGELSKGWSKSWLRPLTVAIWVHVFSARKKHLLTVLLQYPKIYFCFGQFFHFPIWFPQAKSNSVWVRGLTQRKVWRVPPARLVAGCYELNFLTGGRV